MRRGCGEERRGRLQISHGTRINFLMCRKGADVRCPRGRPRPLREHELDAGADERLLVRGAEAAQHLDELAHEVYVPRRDLLREMVAREAVLVRRQCLVQLCVSNQ